MTKKYKFNGKSYKFRGGNQTSYGNLIYDIFKYYLAKNPNETYENLKRVFNKTHCWKNKVVFDEHDYLEWKSTNISTRANDKYFLPSIPYNGISLYFTTQWGNNGNDCDNIDNYISFAIDELHYDINIIIDDKQTTIVDKIIYSLAGKENQVLTGSEISQLIKNHYPDTNMTSIQYTDYCKNHKNIGSTQYEVFEYINVATFKYLGKDAFDGVDNSISAETLKEELEKDILTSRYTSHNLREERLEKANKVPEEIKIISRGFKRNADVVVAVLERAGGYCERCECKAPFLRKDNTPYLEVHHIKMLANGGEDSVENAMAVCPNCHRELHYGK